MILFIDDERSLAGSDVHIARSSTAALHLLTEYEFDEIWFDHDLGGEDTTMPVVDHLAELAFNGSPYPAAIVVHTANPVGRETILRTLRRWGYDCRTSPATTWNQETGKA